MAAGAINWSYPAVQISRALGLIRPAETQAVPRPATRHRGTPEIYFAKTIDNSRLVKVADPSRVREIRMVTVASALLFVVVMVYAWQHFSAIEYGYRIETQKAQRDSLQELNRELRLEEAALLNPERIDVLARRMGLQSPQVGQVQRMEQPPAEVATPVLASNGLGDNIAAR
jgi:cell division protein FtsL